MATIDPVYEANVWLQATLSASSALTAAVGSNVYAHPAPRSVGYPHVTYQCQSPHLDLLVVGTEVLWFELIFLVRAITDQNDDAQTRAAVIAIFDALHGKYGSTANADIVSCIQEKPFAMTELIASSLYLHNGGMYQIQIRPSS